MNNNNLPTMNYPKSLGCHLEEFTTQISTMQLENKFTAVAGNIFNLSCASFSDKFNASSKKNFSILATELFQLKQFIFEDIKVNFVKYEHDFRFEVYTELFEQLEYFVEFALNEFNETGNTPEFYLELLENLPGYNENIISFLERKIGTDFFYNFGFDSTVNLEEIYFTESIDVLFWQFICSIRGAVAHFSPNCPQLIWTLIS